jgi:hypothetical protein
MRDASLVVDLLVALVESQVDMVESGVEMVQSRVDVVESMALGVVPSLHRLFLARAACP